MDKVFIVTCDHGAEGTELLAVLDSNMSDEKAADRFAGRSSYGESERNRWCRIEVQEMDVETVAGTNDGT